MKSLGVLLICQNTTMRVNGARVRIYYVLCSKTYGSFSCLFWFPAGSRRAAGCARFSEICLLATICWHREISET